MSSFLDPPSAAPSAAPSATPDTMPDATPDTMPDTRMDAHLDELDLRIGVRVYLKPQGLEYRLPIAVYGAVLLAMMLPGLGSKLVPVFVYVVALIAMAVLSAGVEPRPGRVYFGACAFVIADSLIGIDRFIVQVPVSEIAIVGIYTVGQFLIFTGMLAAHRDEPGGDRSWLAAD